jgi:hypothetical protein
MKWISVKDELPAIKEKVLVYSTGYFKKDQNTEKQIRMACLRDDGNFQANPGMYWLKVSHWMPLPEKP